jgi:pSer/pThr/pTyr-binding forkhead associated (FHA) protein/uncharacterized OB-fold protein
MITCPSCGAKNDDANRFCDQCGTRLEAPASAAATAADFASQPTAAAATCPSCGAVVLPGEAFCDSCGASLQNVAVASAPADAPTVFAPAENPPATSADGAATVTCPMCGHQNLPGDRFCDNCGAALQGAGAAEAPAQQADTAAQPTAEATAANSATVIEPPPTAPPAPYVPPMQETAEAAAAPVGSPQPAAQPEVVAPPIPEAAPSPAPAASVAPASAPADDPERVRLDDLIGKQRQVVAQLEQTQATLGSLTPPAIQQALDEARNALAKAESDLAALPPPKPPIDPAEVARLEDALTKQRQVVAQLEQTQSALGSLTPPAIQQALDDARASLANTEAELAALTGGGAPTPAATSEAAGTASPPLPAEPATPGEQPPAPPVLETAPPLPATPPTPAEEAPQPSVSTAPPTAPDLQAVPPVAPPPVAPPPAPAGPRFVLADGSAELPLPTDRSEIVVGREDPISQIFPEIDLTPYGGESGGVSRQHARLSHSNGQWTIVDLNSTNYTRVNGARLDPNKPTPIADGAQIQFGRIAVTFHA